MNRTTTNDCTFVTGTTTIPEYDFKLPNYHHFDYPYYGNEQRFQTLVERYMLCDKRTLAEMLAMRDCEPYYNTGITYTTTFTTTQKHNDTITCDVGETSPTYTGNSDKKSNCGECRRKINRHDGWESFDSSHSSQL